MASDPPRIAAIVLAAGKSTRMGFNKLLADLHGAPLIRRTVEAARSWPLDQIVVVTGHEAHKVAAVLEGLDITTVRNDDYAQGLATSLRRGLEALSRSPSPLRGGIKGGGRSGLTTRPPPGATRHPPRKGEGEGFVDAVLVCLGDMPLVEADIVRRLIAAFDPAIHQTICVPVHEGMRGNPVLWGRTHFAAMAALTGDKGAKRLIEQFAEDVVEIEAPRDVVTDADTPDALAHLRSRSRP